MPNKICEDTAVEENLVKIEGLTPQQIASVCDHTFLKRTEAYKGKSENPVKQRERDFKEFLEASIKGLGRGMVPYAICVRPEDCDYARHVLRAERSDIQLCSVVGFPDGNWYPIGMKVMEAELALSYGAREIDMVLNYETFREGNISEVGREITAVNSRVIERQGLLKLIFETSELTEDEVKELSKLANGWGVDFIKTSSGFASGGAEAGKVKLMRKYFGGGVKISGYVKPGNVYELLSAASGRDDGYINLDPMVVRIGESSLLTNLPDKGAE